MKNMKNLIVIIIFIVVIFIGKTCYNNFHTNEIIEESSYNNLIDKDLISIYISDGKGSYNLADDVDLTVIGYEFTDYSCKNGTIITYDDSTEEFSFDLVGSDSCNLFFDANLVFDEGTLSYQILMDNKEDDSLTFINEVAQGLIDKEILDFEIAATTDMGLYTTTDDYGISYYFRGAVDDNWVLFGGYYWRIVRIDGEGNIKLLYSGSSAPVGSQSVTLTGSATTIGDSSFNPTESSVAQSGYVYTESALHGNTIDSYAKIEIDSWFNAEINSYSDYLVATDYCIDRTNYNGTTYKNIYTTANRNYGSYIRTITNDVPSLECADDSDVLSLYAGLLSADEILFAGLTNGTTNTTNYLYRNLIYWTISPSYYTSSVAYTFIVNANGKLVYSNNIVNSYYLIPTISLVNGVTYKSGDGSYNNPYIIA